LTGAKARAMFERFFVRNRFGEERRDKFRGLAESSVMRKLPLRLKRAAQAESGSVFDNRLNVPVVRMALSRAIASRGGAP
jgi:hypothetical protein